jgi:PTS system ascorbate-specific IIA component
MASLLLVAHAPLASSLHEVARHAFADCSARLSAVDVPASASLEQAQQLVAQALEALPGPEVLIMTDAFGATPCNAALKVAANSRARVVAGVNVPMLWRTLCYADLPLAELVTRAVDGARQGVMQVAPTRRQDQPNRPPNDDPDSNPDQ